MNSKLSFLGFVLVLGALLFSGCETVAEETQVPSTGAQVEYCSDRDTGARLSYQEAQEIAQNSVCLEQGQLKETRSCNADTGTWWIDLDSDKPGCMPACVVSVSGRIAEINWRCTGALPSEDAVDVPEGIRYVRDAILVYLGANYGEQAPARDLTWTGDSALPEDHPPGWGEYQFAAGNWVITIGYAVLPPEWTIYQVTVANQDTGFQWAGEVDASGLVAERLASGEVRSAREAALTYIYQYHDHEVTPDQGQIWIEAYTTPEGMVGGVSFEFTTGDWIVTASYPIVAPDAVVYHIVVTNTASGFQWQGKVDAAEQVTELSVPAEGKSVVAWYGSVIGLPVGGQFDDYLALLPDGTAEIGLAGADAEVEAAIVALRDQDEPGKYAHFWGRLDCPAIDYGGCELVVSRLRPDGPGSLFDPDPVEGWEGTIYSGPAGPRSGGDDFFTLVGDYHVQYGIWSPDAAIEGQLQDLRDTGTAVRVWGEIVAGVPDWTGTQIRVSRFEIMEQPSGAVPSPPDWPEPDDGMTAYINEDYGYQLRVPTAATITEQGPVMFSAADVPEGMTDEEYMAQLQQEYGDKLCVHIEYALGYMYISAPPNQEQGFRHNPCGRTGVGAGDLVQKTEEVTIGGKTYATEGFEVTHTTAPCSSSQDTLDCHNETLVLFLEDGTRIEYGARPVSTASFEDYLMKGKGMLLQIIESFASVSTP